MKKDIIEMGHNKKKVSYLNLADMQLENLLGIPFVKKRRHISGDLFCDEFIRSNKVTDVLYEVENGRMDVSNSLIDVTWDKRFYNQNMCVDFTSSDMEELLRFIGNWENDMS